jgi:glycine dehydrogenase subunit 1
LCAQKAHYAAAQLNGGRCSSRFAAPFFKEFVVRDKQGRVDELLAAAIDAGCLAGMSLARWYPDLADCFLVTVTEKRTQDQIDALAQFLRAA